MLQFKGLWRTPVQSRMPQARPMLLNLRNADVAGNVGDLGATSHLQVLILVSVQSPSVATWRKPQTSGELTATTSY